MITYGLFVSYTRPVAFFSIKVHQMIFINLFVCRFASTEPKETQSFVLSSFRGQLQTSQVFPYPHALNDEEKETIAALSEPLYHFNRVIKKKIV